MYRFTNVILQKIEIIELYLNGNRDMVLYNILIRPGNI